MLTCSKCEYTTNRAYNLKRHEINKHYKEILQENNIINNKIEENISPIIEENDCLNNKKNIFALNVIKAIYIINI